jgi:hypothetical protein
MEINNNITFLHEWLEGLADHCQRMGKKYITYTAYANSINLSSANLSLCINKKFMRMSKALVIEIAIKTGYDKENQQKLISVIEQLDWKVLRCEYAEKPETDTDLMDFYGAIPQTEETPNVPEAKKPNKNARDFMFLTEYVKLRQQENIPSESMRRTMRYALLQRLIKNLDTIKENELC